MITAEEIREFVTGYELSDPNWDRVIGAELLYLQQLDPNVPDTFKRDMTLVDLIKHRLAYEGVRAISEAGYSATWEAEHAQIARRLIPSMPV